ncbi:hypothetical protein GCM10023188_36610 [Pontibacter saemangeumensis]|uniref:Lipoprotein n=1 Tax=Pontibacter saemangeumensis TaxID=1084525 RepID=A0ABP8M053_9BACT
MIIRNILYAILLGAGMAACLSQNDEAATESETEDGTAATSATETTPAPAAFVLEKGRAGNIKLGMPIEEVRQQVVDGTAVKDTLLMLEGQQSTAYVLHQDDRDKGLLIEQVCDPDCKVWRISVLSPEYKTAKGIGVGSKYGEVKQAYPISTVAFEEGNFVAVSDTASMSFELDDTQLPQDAKDMGRYNPGNIPDNTLVTRVMLY